MSCRNHYNIYIPPRLVRNTLQCFEVVALLPVKHVTKLYTHTVSFVRFITPLFLHGTPRNKLEPLSHMFYYPSEFFIQLLGVLAGVYN
jgi:hypothetical protein